MSVPTVGAAVVEAEATLAAAGVETPRVDAEWLLAGILDVGRAALAVNARRPLVAVTAARYADAVRRRARREPLQRILGWEDFRGLRFRLKRDVLVPRPETERLVEWSLGFLPAPSGGRSPRVVDVGTGSGCIACALAHARPDLEVIAMDVSPAAGAMAAENADALGLERRVRVVVGDLATALRGTLADLVVANLPYLPDAWLAGLTPEVRAHDPRLALAGGADGLDLVRRRVADARRVLRPGAALVLETAGGDQTDTAAQALTGAGLVDVVTRAYLAGITRFVAGRRP